MGRSVVSVVTLCLTSHRNGNFPHFTLTYPLESFADIRNPWLNKRPPVRAQNNQGQFSAAQVLLIRHVLICGNDDFIPSFLSPIQQGAIVSPACLTNFLLRSGMSALVRTSLDSLLCRVSTQLHPLICSKPAPALDLRSLATNFVRHAG